MPVKIFFCYAHEDEPLLNKLKTHLKPLQRIGLIDVWYDRDISPGTEWEEEIKKHLNEANIILLLVSSDFMNSDYCYGKEMQRALERDKRGEASVIPIILRPVYWQEAPFGKLQALPKDARPVKSWPDQDEAFFNVAEGIRTAIQKLMSSVNNRTETKNSRVRPSTKTPPRSFIKSTSPEPDQKMKEQWLRKGNALGNLKRYEEAIAAYDQPSTLTPPSHPP